MATIVDSLVTLITLDPKGYQQGQQQVERSNKKIKDDIRGLEDQIVAIRQKSTKDTKAQDTAQVNSLREVMRQKRRSLEDNKGREQEQLKREKDQTQALGAVKNAASELFAVLGVAVTAKGLINYAVGIGAADAATQRFAANLGEDMQTVNAFGAVVQQLGGKAEDAKAAFGSLAAIRFAEQGKGDYSMAPTLSRLGVSPQDLNDLDGAMRKIAATAKTMPQALFYQYAHAAGFSDSVINAFELGDVELAKRLEAAKKREGASSGQAKEDQSWQRRFANAGSAAAGGARGALERSETLGDLFVDLAQGRFGQIGSDLDKIKKASPRLAKSMNAPLIGGALGSKGNSIEATRAKFAVDYLKSQGISDAAARGAIAGAIAESHLNPNIVNPTSGAYGIGQWLGARKTALLSKYGPNPTFDQQLQFLALELKGRDRGGAAVLSANSEMEALVAYITKFMRPRRGVETVGDLMRGWGALSALGGASSIDPGLATGARAALAHRAGGNASGAVTNEVQIGRIEVNVPAGSDGKKIAQETAAAVRHQPFVAMANSGLA